MVYLNRGRRIKAIALTRASIPVNKGDFIWVPLPGSSTGQSSIFAGKLLAHLRKMIELAPA